MEMVLANNTRLNVDPVWKHYENVEYIEIDFSGLTTDDEIIDYVLKAVDLGMRRPDKSIRAFVYAYQMKTSPRAMRTIKMLGKQVQPKMKKSVIVGASGILSLLMKIYISYTKSNIKYFTDKETAMKYLIND
ncbi:conserved hypothetical protein [Tenacibaculum sp. 190524A05c]